MLDIDTLRFVLSVLAVLVLTLFYAGVYRPTRSSFAGWWCIALLCTALSPLLLLMNGTSAQVLANPLSSGISVLGATFVWFATRSVRGLTPVWWLTYVLPVAVMIVALFQNPATNRWAGNGPLFAVMGLFFGLAARDMWMAWHARRSDVNWAHDGEARVALFVNALASSCLALFYLWRGVLFAVTGPYSWIFDSTVGPGPIAILLIVTLVAVTFSAAALGYDQQTRELRRRVALDDLTGLLARTAFFDAVAGTIKEPCSSGLDRLLIVADLDHFKSINDKYGHAAGDHALEVFAATVSESLRDGELAGRLGGEEFALLLCATSEADVSDRLLELGREYSRRGSQSDVSVPTISCGVARARPDVPVDQSLARADAAMYRAKAAGRNQVCIDERDIQVGRRDE